MDTLYEIQDSMGLIPTGLKDQPAISEGDRQYFDGFRVLGRSRAFGQHGPCPISIADVQAYLSMIGEYQVEERLKFLRFMQDMDTVYLEHFAKQSAPSP